MVNLEIINLKKGIDSGNYRRKQRRITIISISSNKDHL